MAIITSLLSILFLLRAVSGQVPTNEVPAQVVEEHASQAVLKDDATNCERAVGDPSFVL